MHINKNVIQMLNMKLLSLIANYFELKLLFFFEDCIKIFHDKQIRQNQIQQD